MNEPRITALRNLQLGVADLDRSRSFYTKAWGLELVSEEAGTQYFRARGPEHHALCLRQTPTPQFLGVGLAAPDRAAVDALADRAAQAGFATSPEEPAEASGGGYGITVTGPEGLRVTIASDAATLPLLPADPSRPSKLTHVVINSADVPAQMGFFLDILGFRLSDSTARMQFIRCGTDHHAIALVPGTRLSLNHAAFEMPHIDGLMYGAGRLIDNGVEIEWGLGRHGPGSNVFTYFVDPDGFAVEYTTEMQQIGDDYVSRDAEYWGNFPKRPCRWGVARKPSERLMAAMAGKLGPASR